MHVYYMYVYSICIYYIHVCILCVCMHVVIKYGSVVRGVVRVRAPKKELTPIKFD